MDEATAHASKILARLRLHYPTLLPSDERLAAPLAKEWLAEIVATPDPDAIVGWMVTEWAKDRAPRLADWVLSRRTSVHQATVAAEHRAELFALPVVEDLAKALSRLPDARPRESREVIAARQRTARAEEYARDHTARHRDSASPAGWSPLNPSASDALAVRALGYDEVYAEPAREEPDAVS